MWCGISSGYTNIMVNYRCIYVHFLRVSSKQNPLQQCPLSLNSRTVLSGSGSSGNGYNSVGIQSMVSMVEGLVTEYGEYGGRFGNSKDWSYKGSNPHSLPRVWCIVVQTVCLVCKHIIQRNSKLNDIWKLTY